MENKLFLVCLFFLAYVRVGSAQAPVVSHFDVEQIKKEITLQLAQDLSLGQSHTRPLLILIGGFPGAGKTTLIQAIADDHDVTVISWNAIRQALLDRRLKGSPFDWEIIKDVYQNLLKICLQNRVHVAIDANAYAQNIRRIESFIASEQYEQIYKIVKICLNPPTETLFKRIRARMQKEGIHQGTEGDLRRDLDSPAKKIDLNEYALILNTEEISFETEREIINLFLEGYLFKSAVPRP
jgi:predicted kinase